jgi:hypothetical protein
VPPAHLIRAFFRGSKVHFFLAKDEAIGGKQMRGVEQFTLLDNRMGARHDVHSGFGRQALEQSLVIGCQLGKAMTGWSFCTKASERVYITASGCEIEFGATRGL